MLCTMNMSCRSSIAPSIQLLKGAALFANSRYNWSIVSQSFSTRYGKAKRRITAGPHPLYTVNAIFYSYSSLPKLAKELMFLEVDFYHILNSRSRQWDTVKPKRFIIYVYLQWFPPFLGQGAQVVPLVTNALASGIDGGSIIKVKFTKEQCIFTIINITYYKICKKVLSLFQGSRGVSILLELLCNGSDLFYSVLMSSQVALKGLVFPH